MINTAPVPAFKATPAPDHPPPKRCKVIHASTKRECTESSPINRETRRPKRSHDVMSTGALIHSELGVQYRLGSARHRLVPFSSKKHCAHQPLTNWRRHPRKLSKVSCKNDLFFVNSRWSKLYRDAPEKIDRVHIDETRNNVIFVKSVLDFITDHEERILVTAEKFGICNDEELYGFAREFAYAAHWTVEKRMDRIEKELGSTLDGKYWAVSEGRASRRKRKPTVFFRP